MYIITAEPILNSYNLVWNRSKQNYPSTSVPHFGANGRLDLTATTFSWKNKLKYIFCDFSTHWSYHSPNLFYKMRHNYSSFFNFPLAWYSEWNQTGNTTFRTLKWHDRSKLPQSDKRIRTKCIWHWTSECYEIAVVCTSTVTLNGNE